MTTSLDSIICLRPFFALELNVKGDVSVCCPAWSKAMVGNTYKKPLRDIWNDRPLRHMRQMILEGRWEKICRPNCPVIMKYRMSGEKTPLAHQSRGLVSDALVNAVLRGETRLAVNPTWVNFANSATCNLNCIMCGREHFHDDAHHQNGVMSEVMGLLPDLKELFLTGNGDPFARSDTRNFLLELDGSKYPSLKINLLTNGILLPSYWDRIRDLNFGFIDVSVDAASRQTYEKIRRGGKWREILRALEVISAHRNHFSYTGINMTVMRDNFREIPAFVQLAGQYGFGVGINRIRGKWGDQNFFTSNDETILKELRGVIVEARELAETLSVPFNCASFGDILSGETMPRGERYLQMAVDTAMHLSYRLKAFRKRQERT